MTTLFSIAALTLAGLAAGPSNTVDPGVRSVPAPIILVSQPPETRRDRPRPVPFEIAPNPWQDHSRDVRDDSTKVDTVRPPRELLPPERS